MLVPTIIMLSASYGANTRIAMIVMINVIIIIIIIITRFKLQHPQLSLTDLILAFTVLISSVSADTSGFLLFAVAIF